MNRPNLFSFASSELSQDAFICWLLSWAEYKETEIELYLCAMAFIKAIFDKHEKAIPDEIKTIVITKQDKNIDVLCVINNNYAIIIEDKTGTKQHSNQLEKYYKDVKRRTSEKHIMFSAENILPIYYKTGDQAWYSDVEKNGYKPFLRKDILNILDDYKGDNSILIDYKDYLQSISNKVLSYTVNPIDDWSRKSWVGFYIELQKRLPVKNWDYVPNPSGGFLGLWFLSYGDEHCKQYIQLEEKKLCFKIMVTNPQERKDLRRKWYKIIMSKAEKTNLPLKRPERFGNGKYMTVCLYDGDYRQTNYEERVDIEETINLIKETDSLLSSAHGDNLIEKK